MPQADNPASRTPLPVRVFGWLVGALSFLNLIRDLTFVQVYGLIREWLDAYDLLVETLSSFLFGWIDWRWIRLDDAESHVLVIGILLGSMAGRASHRTELDKANSASSIKQTMLAVNGVLLRSMAESASHRTELDKPNFASSIKQTMLAVIGIGGFVALPLLLVPSPVGLWIGLLFAVGILASSLVGGNWVDEDYVKSSHFRRELVIVGACVAIILLIGHFLAWP